MGKNTQVGDINFTPYYVLCKETKLLMPIHLIADAVIYEARPGIKEGNSVLERTLREINKQNQIDNQ